MMNVNDKPKITVGTVCYNAVSCIESTYIKCLREE